jgi:hypothetical protein
MVATQSLVLRSAERLSHLEATRLAAVAERSTAHTIILDASKCLEATTPALARLVLLRRELLQSGRDFRIAGLKGQPAKLLEVHRLENVLLPVSEIPRESNSRTLQNRHLKYSPSLHADNAVSLCLQ